MTFLIHTESGQVNVLKSLLIKKKKSLINQISCSLILKQSLVLFLKFSLEPVDAPVSIVIITCLMRHKKGQGQTVP